MFVVFWTLCYDWEPLNTVKRLFWYYRGINVKLFDRLSTSSVNVIGCE